MLARARARWYARKLGGAALQGTELVDRSGTEFQLHEAHGGVVARHVRLRKRRPGHVQTARIGDISNSPTNDSCQLINLSRARQHSARTRLYTQTLTHHMQDHETAAAAAKALCQ